MRELDSKTPRQIYIYLQAGEASNLWEENWQMLASRNFESRPWALEQAPLDGFAGAIGLNSSRYSDWL